MGYAVRTSSMGGFYLSSSLKEIRFSFRLLMLQQTGCNFSRFIHRVSFGVFLILGFEFYLISVFFLLWFLGASTLLLPEGGLLLCSLVMVVTFHKFNEKVTYLFKTTAKYNESNRKRPQKVKRKPTHHSVGKASIFGFKGTILNFRDVS